MKKIQSVKDDNTVIWVPQSHIYSDYFNIEELKDLRRAVIDEDLSSIFRLAQSISANPEKFEEFRKAFYTKWEDYKPLD